jgi:hypothetical protein
MSADKDGLLHRSRGSVGSLETATTDVSNLTDGHSWHLWVNVGAAAADGRSDKDGDAPPTRRAAAAATSKNAAKAT